MHKTKQYSEIQSVTNFALFISISIVLSIFDALIPFNIIIPGFKLGLSNLILIILLDYYSLRQLILFQFLKITVTTFILGIFSVYIFSISGGMLALFMMYFFKKVLKNKITVYTLSMVGAISHNIGQIIVAIFYLKTIELIFYIPFLVVYGCITGFILGYIITKISPYIKRRI